MRITRRSMIAGAVLAPFLTRSRIARAQSWPSGIIKIIVPFPPGGTVDPIARLVQTGLQQRLGATIVIENKSGGSGSAGTAAVAKSAPDGNTWLFVFDTHAVNPFLLPYAVMLIAIKYAGYKIGRAGHLLPRALCAKLSGQDYYWSSPFAR